MKFKQIIARLNKRSLVKQAQPPRDDLPCSCGSRYHNYRFETRAYTRADGVFVNEHYNVCGKCDHRWPRY